MDALRCVGSCGGQRCGLAVVVDMDGGWRRNENQSKQHVNGTPGSAFSKCVTDMAKLASGSVKNPRTA
jgi:hypothetical protein